MLLARNPEVDPHLPRVQIHLLQMSDTRFQHKSFIWKEWGVLRPFNSHNYVPR